MIIDLKQGTPEWESFRKNKIGASDVAPILGISPWKTARKLWEQKLGVSPPEKRNWAMQRGIDLEERARNCFFMEKNIYVKPIVFVHPEYPFLMASLDGMCENLQIAVEIKCNGPENHKLALQDIIPDYYFCQMQHQMFVCELEHMFYYSFDGQDGVCLIVKRDEEFIKNMLEKELEFYECMQEHIPPNMTGADYLKKNDAEFQNAVDQYRLIKNQLKELQKMEEDAKNQLIQLAENSNCEGFGIRVTKSTRKGTIDYGKIPELIGVDFDKYRKQETIYWTITETKGENE